jgi:hypothetical protein
MSTLQTTTHKEDEELKGGDSHPAT